MYESFAGCISLALDHVSIHSPGDNKKKYFVSIPTCPIHALAPFLQSKQDVEEREHLVEVVRYVCPFEVVLKIGHTQLK